MVLNFSVFINDKNNFTIIPYTNLMGGLNCVLFKTIKVSGIIGIYIYLYYIAVSGKNELHFFNAFHFSTNFRSFNVYFTFAIIQKYEMYNRYFNFSSYIGLLEIFNSLK